MSFDLTQFSSTVFHQWLLDAGDEDAQWALISSQFSLLLAYAKNLKDDLDQANAQLAALPAPTTASGSGSSRGSRSKVEIYQDPGTFNREINKFEDWWLGMKTWISINSDTISPKSYKAVVAVLSRMKGPRAGTFATALHMV